MRRSAQRRVLNVIAAVEAVREQHQELSLPASPRVVWRVLAREGIDVRRGRIRRKARSSKFDGDAVIMLNTALSPREAWKWALHEYGHLRLHFPEHGEFERQLAPCRAGDPREDEATLFALLLALGPAATPETPEVAALAAKMETRDLLKRRPPQLHLEIPEPPPAYRDESPPIPPPPNAQLLALARAEEKKRPRWESDDSRRIKFYDAERGATRFTDVDDRQWWIYNFRREAVGARVQWTRISDYMSRDIELRVFVNRVGDRRLYRFANRREARDYRVKHLDRQLREATPTKAKERPNVQAHRVRDRRR